MYMKKRFLFVAWVAWVFGTGVYAQSEKKVRLGVKAGVNFQNINGKTADGIVIDNKIVPRYHVGLTADVEIAPDFYLQPNLLFVTKGTKGKTGSPIVTLNYVEIPVHFLYTPELGSGRLILGAGPYLAIAASGKLKDENTNITYSLEIKNSLAVGENGVRPLDAGANLLAGYELSNHINFQFFTQLGLVNIKPAVNNVSNAKETWKNTGFGFSVGYKF